MRASLIVLGSIAIYSLSICANPIPKDDAEAELESSNKIPVTVAKSTKNLRLRGVDLFWRIVDYINDVLLHGTRWLRNHQIRGEVHLQVTPGRRHHGRIFIGNRI